MKSWLRGFWLPAVTAAVLSVLHPSLVIQGHGHEVQGWIGVGLVGLLAIVAGWAVARSLHGGGWAPSLAGASILAIAIGVPATFVMLVYQDPTSADLYGPGWPTRTQFLMLLLLEFGVLLPIALSLGWLGGRLGRRRSVA
jgi:hypothetical protein